MMLLGGRVPLGRTPSRCQSARGSWSSSSPPVAFARRHPSPDASFTPSTVRTPRPFFLSTTAVRRDAPASSSKLAAPKDAADKAFAHTLLLPKTPFPLRADAKRREALYRKRTTDELYRWQWENNTGSVFVLHDGPPYANGHLHMGHAMNKILKDIINRYKVLRGHRVHYMPGWDCHGLPIEQKALAEKLKDRDFRTIYPVDIRRAARETAQEGIALQRGEFQRFGIMADWSQAGTYRTLDRDYEMAQLQVFSEMVRKGLIYRKHKPVYWSPSSRTALAEAELVYEDNHTSKSVYVRFPLRAGPELVSAVKGTPAEDKLGEAAVVIWTTTPWTLPSNMAVAVHPELRYCLARLRRDDSYMILARDRLPALRELLGDLDPLAEFPGSALLDSSYTHLFLAPTSPPRPIVTGCHVTSDSGTGLVHSAPAHGAEDYLLLDSLGLLKGSTAEPASSNLAGRAQEEMICPVDEDGRFTGDVASLGDFATLDLASRLQGKDVQGAGAREVIKLLEENGVLLGQATIRHKYPYDWRTKKPVITRATSQWFANIDEIKERALQVVDNIRFSPETGRNRLKAFVQGRSEWCISRQRAWGVPIPVLYDAATDEPLLTEASVSHIAKVLGDKGTDYWWEGPVDEFLPEDIKKEGRSWRKGTDTMDVWFDSGVSWARIRDLRLRSHADEVADVYLEGSDQHRGWFQSSLLTSLSTTGKAPCRHIITHGFALDSKGNKMSKSLGNVVSPFTVTDGGKDLSKEPAYGADVLRLWAAAVEYKRDVPVGTEIMRRVFDKMKKLRNTARFILGNVPADQSFRPVSKAEMSLIERYVMNEVYHLERTARDAYDAVEFNKVVDAVTNFSNVTISAFYFDITKDCLYTNAEDSLERRAVLTVLREVFRVYVSILAPIAPHLAEEVHHFASGAIQDPAEGQEAVSPTSIFRAGWQHVAEEWRDDGVKTEMEALIRVRDRVLALLERARKAKDLKSSLEAEVDVRLPSSPASASDLAASLRRHADVLRTLFIVSDVHLVDDPIAFAAGPSPPWSYADEVDGIALRVRPARREKCPRCWTFTREHHERVCTRCEGVLRSGSAR